MSASAGWYPDPQDPSRWAWWDGRQWLAPTPPSPDATSRYDDDETRTWLPTLRPMRTGAALLAIAATLVIVAANLFGSSDPQDVDPAGAIIGLVALAFMAVGIPLLAWLSSAKFGSRRFTRDLGWRIHWWDLPLGVAGAMVMWGLALGMGLFTKLIGLPQGSNTDVIEEQMQENPQAAFVLLLFMLGTAAVLAPLTEELLFRGMLLRGLLSKMPVWPAIAVQGVIFGVAHTIPSLGAANVGLILVLIPLGLALGVQVWLTGRLWSGIIAHALFNASNVILLYLTTT